MWSYTIFLPLGVTTAAKGGSENLLFFREHIECTESCVVLCRIGLLSMIGSNKITIPETGTTPFKRY